MAYTLAELARRVGAEIRGDAECLITGVDTLQDAAPGAIAFLANRKYRRYLATTQASAVVITPDLSAECPVTALICDNPQLCFARIENILFPPTAVEPGVHASAVVAASAEIDPTAQVGPCAVIGEGCRIGPGVSIGAGCVIGRDCAIGQDSRLLARVTLCDGTQLGRRVLLHPGAVIGSDGFGLVKDGEVWVKVPQLGRVRIGDDVEVGANTTIDRGALQDTVIGNGVKLDNQIQIAHNVTIGENTAVAGCAGISGSTHVGRNCTIGGGVGLAGHLEIGDDVHFTGQSLVTRSFTKPGLYSGNLPAVPNLEWRKSIARLRQLDDMMRRLKRLEKQLAVKADAAGADDT